MVGDLGERSDAGLNACWSCKGPVSQLVQFCHTCGAIQPPGNVDHFRRLGFPAEFDIDGELLERRYIGLQRHLHPDRFVSKAARERALAEAQAVSLNEAYETLKDPLKRAVYLLRLKDGDIDLDRDHTIQDKALLMEVMELREALAEAATSASVESLAAKAGSETIGVLAAISSAFAKDDLRNVGRLVIRLKYLRKFLEEARNRLAALEMA